MNDTVGSRIKAAREAAGLSQRALAEQLGEKQSFVEAYENNRRKPGLEVVLRFARALGLVPCDLLPDEFKRK